MPADAAASSPSVIDLQRRIEELSVELRARTTERDESLQRETATAEVLQVINRSPGDLVPVVDTMVDKAMALCGAAYGGLVIYEGERIRAASLRNLPPAFQDFWKDPMPVDPESNIARVLRSRQTAYVADLADTDGYRKRVPIVVAGVEQGGVRSVVWVPLLSERGPVGLFFVFWKEVHPVTPKQIALLESFAAQAVIAMENARLLTELRQRTDDLTESLEYQTATSELLEVISRSTTDVQPVLDTMLASAARLCGTNSGGIAIRRGAGVSYVASFGQTAEFDRMWRTHEFMPDEATVTGRVLLTRQVVHVADMAEDLDHSLMESVTLGGMRTALGVPLLRGGEPIGVIMLNRDRVEPFTDRQIALVKTFADQAVIAMENTRLLGELRESLDQQTATAEILETINRSQGDLEPVFGAIVDKAMALCDAAFGMFNTFDGRRFYTVATRGISVAHARYRASNPPDYGPDTGPGRLIAGEDCVHDIDAADSDAYRRGEPNRRAMVDLGGARTILNIALRKEGRLLGMIAVYRQEVRPFDDQQIALLQNFAAQAVIAMENARLLGELRESLDQQTATSDVLSTISRSSVDLPAVLNTLVETVSRLCRADQAYMFRRQEGLHHLVASHNVSDETIEYMRANPFKPDRGNTSGRVLLERRTVHIPDVLADPEYTYSEGQKIAGFRTMLGIPLMREDTILGVFVASRTRVEPFTDKEITLASGFADQAVIAIENARLFEELTNRQAELRTTFDNIGDGVVMFDDQLRLAAWNRNFQELLDISDDFLAKRPSYDDYVGMLIERGEFGSVNREAETRRLLRDVGRQWSRERTRPDGRVIEVRNNPVPGGGTVAIYSDITRRKKAEAEIAAARDAAEAALERQTATADILKVIASSPTDVQPVLDVVAKAAVQFCGATDAVIHLRDGDEALSAAHEGTVKSVMGVRRPLDRQTTFGRAMLDGVTIQFPDVEALDPVEFALTRRLAGELGFRAVIGAPLLREGAAIGALTLRRVEPGPFTPQQIELLETFAAQAVIAIENVRLFTELREALEQQTATAEILSVISQSPTDVAPVLSAVAKAALKFCGARDAQVILRDGDHWFVAATEGSIGFIPGPRPLNRHTTPGRAILDGEVVQIADVQSAAADEFPESRDNAARLGFRSALAAPLLRDGVSIGAIALRRPEPGPFTPNQVELLKSFAAQAVIAIENVRLFTELRESLERLKAAQANLIQAEKMASLGQLTAGIAHEIKNPLNFVNNFAGLSVELLDELREAAAPVLTGMDEDARAEFNETIEMITANLNKIAEHGRRADGIVKSMLAHSRGGTGDWQTTNINNLIEEALNLAYHGARAQDKDFNVTLERDFEATAMPIDVVPQDVTRVFLNLFGNGFYASRKRQRDSGDSAYRPVLKIATRDLGDSVEIRVRDNGIGISAEVREKLFQPFFTTKPTGEGTGLGLSISYDIVTQQHGGSIEVESEVGQYTEFTVRLPRARRAAV